MENKINLVELLKDCPKGMELDCAMFGNLEFEYIDEGNPTYPIICRVKCSEGGYNNHAFTLHGCYNTFAYSKCVIFPKGKTTWEGFAPPCDFKDGDILVGESGYPFIFKSLNNSNGCCSYCGLDLLKNFKLDSNDWTFADSLRFATEGEKAKLFQEIKNHGYKWNAETKTLEKLIKPRFKVGDRIKWKGHDASGRIEKIEDNVYHVDFGYDDGVVYVGFRSQDDYELAPDKFDIATLKPFDKVLVMYSNVTKWNAELYSHYDEGMTNSPFCCMGTWYEKCIPYEGNEHLLGTDDECDEYYKNWE